MNAPPLVSVVVPTRNSADSLHVCLESIVHQSYSSVEVVVVDNNSTDDTLAIARASTPLVYVHGPERSAQRNAGARASGGSYLLFIDSDMVLARDVIEQCVRLVTQEPAVTAIIIPERSAGEGFWARCKALERSCYVGDDTIEAARFFARDAFAAGGGYGQTRTRPQGLDLGGPVA